MKLEVESLTEIEVEVATGSRSTKCDPELSELQLMELDPVGQGYSTTGLSFWWSVRSAVC